MGWNRKQFKSNAKITVKKNYRMLILVCILLMFISGEFEGTKELLISSMQVSATGSTILNSLSSSADSKVVDEFVKGVSDVDEAEQNAEDKIESYHPTRGVLAKAYNSVTGDGDVATSIVNSVNHMFFNNKIGAGIVILLGAFFQLLFTIFVGKVLYVGGMRAILEARRYYKTRTEKVLFGYQIKKVFRIGFVMFRTMAYEFLWSLTIVGYFIKRYSYKMVPFIVAENPEIDGKTAIKLSRQMMNGYKWKTFVMELSFIGWNLLSSLTFGLVSIFYLNPYQTAAYSEVYMMLRKQAKANSMPLSEYLNDACLDLDEPIDDVYPLQNFGIQVAPSRKWLTIDFRKNYTIQHLILIFFSFAFVGWCWEVGLHLVADGAFVNRGVLLGPWLPIYGAGSILVLVLLKPFRENHILTFLLSILVCGIVEYVSSVYLEMAHGMKWWDYSGYLLNINGRVCLEGLLVFGLGCYAIIYIVAPLIDNLLSKIPTKIAWAVAGILIILFAVDLVHSKYHPNIGKGITDYQSCVVSEEYWG